MSEGGHGLGPHVIGQRVVVRRLLPGETGPTGGPAFADTLGICEAWADGEAVLRTADGSTVVVPTALIVSGKPVPPRPSARQRVGVRDAESHAGPLWVGVERVALGDWEMRSVAEPDGRLLKRTNSALAIGDPGVPFEDALEAVLAFYGERGRGALVQVESDTDVEDAFRGRGWSVVPGGDAVMLLGSTARALRLAGPRPACDLTVDGPRLVATTSGARGRAAIDGDWLGVHDLYVEEDRRRQGLATAVLATLLDAGAERGATTCWLHVENDNDAARLLYEGLGLAEHHGCRYLAPPV
jgi:ribosomal protein S18 acetylase RimI-like enzyme